MKKPFGHRAYAWAYRQMETPLPKSRHKLVYLFEWPFAVFICGPGDWAMKKLAGGVDAAQKAIFLLIELSILLVMATLGIFPQCWPGWDSLPDGPFVTLRLGRVPMWKILPWLYGGVLMFVCLPLGILLISVSALIWFFRLAGRRGWLRKLAGWQVQLNGDGT